MLQCGAEQIVHFPPQSGPRSNSWRLTGIGSAPMDLLRVICSTVAGSTGVETHRGNGAIQESRLRLLKPKVRYHQSREDVDKYKYGRRHRHGPMTCRRRRSPTRPAGRQKAVSL